MSSAANTLQAIAFDQSTDANTSSMLTAEALRAVVEEFTTRDGTDHSPVGQRIESVLAQLAAGTVELHFDDELKSCNVVPV